MRSAETSVDELSIANGDSQSSCGFEDPAGAEEPSLPGPSDGPASADDGDPEPA